MRYEIKPSKLPLVASAFGGIALVIRRLLYALAVDEKNLLLRGHPLEWLLLLLSAGVLLLLWQKTRKLNEPEAYENPFPASRKAMAGNLAAAAGIALTVLNRQPAMEGYLGIAWKVLGWLSSLCLIGAGWCRGKGKMPFFGLQLLPCLFLAVHIINHYRLWSGNPQFQDYCFAMLGTMALMLFAFYCGAFAAGLGNRSMQLFMGLAAVYLLMGELARAQDLWLCLGGIAWAMTDLCCLESAAPAENTNEKET